MPNTMIDLQMLWLIGFVVALLLAASGISMLLQARAGGEPGPVLINLRQRVNAWWVMVAVFTLSLVPGRTGVFCFYAILSFLALREFVTLAPTPRADHRTLAWIFFAILPLHYLFAWAPWYGMFLIFIPVYAFVFIPIRSVLAGDIGGFLERTAKMQWGLLVCVYFLSYLPMLLYLPIEGFEGRQARLLFFVVFVTQASDVFQYVFGKWLGRRRIAPGISPNKTVEGLVFGGGAATLAGGCLWWATPFSLPEALALSLLLVVVGFLGGLVMSAVKRSLDTKDWGSVIPGHGGVLDRLDSLLFAAPVFFHVVCYYFGANMAEVYRQPGWLRQALRLWID